MTRLTAIVAAVLLSIGLAHTAAATPEDCAESDTVPPDVGCPEDGDNYPIVLPTSATVPTTTDGGDSLPSTGSSSPLSALQFATVLLVAGLVVVIGVRRRGPDATA